MNHPPVITAAGRKIRGEASEHRGKLSPQGYYDALEWFARGQTYAWIREQLAKRGEKIGMGALQRIFRQENERKLGAQQKLNEITTAANTAREIVRELSANHNQFTEASLQLMGQMVFEILKDKNAVKPDELSSLMRVLVSARAQDIEKEKLKLSTEDEAALALGKMIREAQQWPEAQNAFREAFAILEKFRKPA